MADDKHLGGAAGGLFHPVGHRMRRCQQCSAFGEKQFAGRGERQATTLAPEQPGVEFLLQLLHRAAESLLANVQGGRRGG